MISNVCSKNFRILFKKKKKKNTIVIIAHVPTNAELKRKMDIRSHLDEPTETFS